MWKSSRRKSLKATSKETTTVKTRSRSNTIEVPSVPLSRKSVEIHLQRTKSDSYDRIADGWIDSIPASPYAQLPPLKPVVTPIVTRHDSPTERSQRPTSPEKTPPVRTRKSSISSTSTLFERSTAIPISIIVTTPDDDIVTEHSNGPAIRRTDSAASLPLLNSQIVPDRTRLMPPIDPQLDMRRLRKAREFEEIRMFLIGFLNTKGAKLPGNLRVRIMSIYGITEGNLDPRVVEKFGRNDCVDLDESLVLNLGLQGGTSSNRDHMRILDLAFQSVLPTATPMAAGDLMALRRRSMMAPARKTASSSASLYSVDETSSSVSQNMSLAVNNKSKQLMDDIIKKRSIAQKGTLTSALSDDVSHGSFKRTPGRPQSLFSRRTSFSRATAQKAESLYTPEPKSSASSIYSRRDSLSSVRSQPSVPSQRPQSLYRFKTDPVPVLDSRSAPPKPPLPTFNNTSLKSRQPTGEFKPVISITPYKPAVPSRLSSSPLNAYRAEPSPKPATQNPVFSRYAPISATISTTATANKISASQNTRLDNSKQAISKTSPGVVVTKTVKVSPEPLPSPPVKIPVVPFEIPVPPRSPLRTPARTPSLKVAESVKLEMLKPTIASIRAEQFGRPLSSVVAEPPVAGIASEAESEQVQDSQPATEGLPAPSHISEPIEPEALKKSAPATEDRVIHCPTPIAPAHRLTHKGLTRSEISDIEKPFYIRRRRSSSTHASTTPASPLFSSPADSEVSSNGYESDSSGVVFPVHPGFAPLGREKCGASMKVDEMRARNEAAEKKMRARQSVIGTKLNEKTAKKEKRSSFFGSLKKTLLGRS